MNMTDEQILAAAEATGLKLITLGLDKQKSEFLILAFAKYVGKIERFKEREACMNVLRGLNYAQSSKYDCMDAIRSRGEQA